MVQVTELEKTEHLARGCKMAKSLKLCYKTCKKEILPQAGHVSCMGMAEKNSCLKTVTYEPLRWKQKKCHRRVEQMRNGLSLNVEEKTGKVRQSF